MGFGLLNKCVMYWNSDDDIFWPEENYWFSLITPEDKSYGMCTTFFNPSKQKGFSCLIVCISGDESLSKEEETDE